MNKFRAAPVDWLRKSKSEMSLVLLQKRFLSRLVSRVLFLLALGAVITGHKIINMYLGTVDDDIPEFSRRPPYRSHHAGRGAFAKNIWGYARDVDIQCR